MITKVQVPMEGPYDQFMLFGDSLFQQSCSQAAGFAFCPALQDGMTRLLDFFIATTLTISLPLPG